MDMPIVAGMNADQDHPSRPAMAGAVAGAAISIALWALIGGILYLLV